MKKRFFNMIFFCIMLLLLLFIVLKNINSLNGLVVVGDEYGYWANVAFLGKLDWSDVNKLNPYYGYGYSLFLIPVILLENQPIIAYKMGIIINAVFISISFIISIVIGRKLFPQVNDRIIILISCLLQTYPILILLSQYTVGEALQYLLYWLVVLWWIKFVYSKKIFYLLLLNLSLVFLFAAHLRNLGVVVIALLCQFTYILKKHLVNKKQVINICFCFAIIVLGITLSIFIKKYISANLLGLQNQQSDVNGFGGQVSKLGYLFTLPGMKAFISNLIGNIYSGITNSFMLLLFAFYFIIKRIIRRNKEDSQFVWVYAFILLAYIAEIAISSIFMIRGSRMDCPVYGRYSDQVICQLLLVAMYEFHINKTPWKLMFSFCTFYNICGILIYFVMLSKNPIFYQQVSPMLGYIALKTGTEHSPYMNYIAVLIITSISMLIYIMINYSKNSMKVLALFMIGVLWLNCGLYHIDTTLYKHQDECTETNMLASNLKSSDKDIYFINNDSHYINIEKLQFALWNQKINVINDVENINISDSCYIIICRQADLPKQLLPQCKLVYETAFYNVFEYC